MGFSANIMSNSFEISDLESSSFIKFLAYLDSTRLFGVQLCHILTYFIVVYYIGRLIPVLCPLHGCFICYLNLLNFTSYGAGFAVCLANGANTYLIISLILLKLECVRMSIRLGIDIPGFFYNGHRLPD